MTDLEGFEATSLDAARDAMVVSIRELLVPQLQTGVLNLTGAIDICDEAGGVLETVAYRDAVTVSGL